MIEDPLYLVRARNATRKRGLNLDFMGLLLIATFLGPLQIMLDRGEKPDWFQSHLILALGILSAASMLALVWWEWTHKRPVVDLRLFRHRTFALATLLMFVVGFVLYGSIVLLPQYVQVVLGWSAAQAGMVLSPGGATLMLLMPLVGLLVSRLDARWLIAFGFLISALALYHMTVLRSPLRSKQKCSRHM